MLCNLNIDGQTFIGIGMAVNAAYIACNHLVKKKPRWLMFLMGAAAGFAIVMMVIGMIKLRS